MSKIDIAIKVTSGGAQEPVVSATGPWVSCVRDVRDIFTQLEHFEGKFITMLSFCPTGSLLTIVHHIPGRTTDNVAAWLHIPTGCAVTGEELSVLIADVKRYLSSASRIDQAELSNLVSRQYLDLAGAVSYQPSPKDGGFAFRGTDFYPLSDILGEGRYQDYYLRYKYVFIIDRLDSVQPRPGVADLTRNELGLYTTILPPPQEDLTRLLGPRGSLVYTTPTQSFLPFSAPLRVKRGQVITFYAYKEGFESIPMQVAAKEIVQYFTFPPDFMPVWYKKLTFASFQILETGSQTPVRNARIKVNGVPLQPDGMKLTEEQARSAVVSVSAGGYEPYEGTHFLGTKDPIKLSLKKSEAEYRFNLETINHQNAELVVRTRGFFNPDKSPLEGYTAHHRTLIYDDKARKKSFWLGFSIAAVIALLAGLIYFGVRTFVPSLGGRQGKGADTTVVKKVVGKPQEPAVSEEAIKYLNENTKWERGKMEQIPGLKGLWDAMNQYDYTDVKNKLEPFKDRSPRANELYKAVSDCLEKQNYKTGSFNGAGDYTITVTAPAPQQGYIQKISRTMPQPTSPGPGSGVSAGGGGNRPETPQHGSAGSSESSESDDLGL